MLHGIPAQFLRINKITQNFRTAFSLVLLEMLLMGEKNCFVFFPPYLVVVSAVSLYKNIFSYLLSFSSPFSCQWHRVYICVSVDIDGASTEHQGCPIHSSPAQ